MLISNLSKIPSKSLNKIVSFARPEECVSLSKNQQHSLQEEKRPQFELREGERETEISPGCVQAVQQGHLHPPRG